MVYVTVLSLHRLCIPNRKKRKKELPCSWHKATRQRMPFKVLAVVQLLSCVQLLATPWTARLPRPSPSPGVSSNSCPFSCWCRPTISSSITLFSCSQSFPVSESFPWISLSHHKTKELEPQHHSFQLIFRVNFL